MIAVMSGDFVPLLRGLPGARRALADGAPLFHAGDPVQAVWLVLEGAARLRRPDGLGATLALHRAGAGEIVAEASAFSDAYHCDATAEGASLFLAVPRTAFRARLRADGAFAEAFAAHLARALRAARDRAAMLGLRGVEDRLEAWLAAHGGALPARGGWSALAEELGVTRPALYRALARRRARGVAAD